MKGYITRITTVIEPISKEDVQKMTDGTEQAPAVTDESAADLEAKLKAIRDKEAEEKVAAVSNPLLDQVAASDEPNFIDKLRNIAADLKEAGKLGESEVLAAGEESTITATLIKLVGEIVEKIKV